MENSEVKILLVGNQQMMRQGLRELIAGTPGLRVVGEAFDSQSAMDQIRTLAPHLVLMDIHRPGESEVENIRRMVEEFPSVKVIALSGSSELELVLQVLYAGVSGYVVKNHDFEELTRAIKAVMVHRLYLSPEVSGAVILDFLKTFTGRKPGRAGVILSDRERLLLRLIAEGKRNKEIAGDMVVTSKSAETYRYRLMKKLGCASVAELIRYAIREGIIQA